MPGTYWVGTLAFVAAAALAAPSRAADDDARYAVASWGAKDGLPSQSVWSITQDRDGYLWVGTARGLARFDGTRFVAADRTAPPVANLGVPALTAASDGSVWQSFWGIPRVDRILGDRVETFGPGDGLPDGTVQALLEDREGVIWAGARGGVARFREGRWERVRVRQADGDLTVWTLHEDRTGTLWAGTSDGIFRRAAGAESFLQVGAGSPLVRGFAEGADGSVWIVDAKHGPHSLAGPRPPTLSFTVDELRDASRIFSDRAGNVWLTTHGRGLLRRDHSSVGVVDRYTVDDGLSGNVAICLYEDRERNLWVGTADGLTRLSEAPITPWPVFDGASGLVKAVTVGKDGTVWIGTRRGLIRFAHGVRKSFGPREGLTGSIVTALHADGGDALWVATTLGLLRYQAGRFVPAAFAAGLIDISAITSDRHGGLWICDRDKGIFRWHGGELRSLAPSPPAAQNPVASIFADRRGGVWIGFWSGAIAVYHGERFDHYGTQHGLPGGPVTAIFEDDRGLWIGTTNGLSRFEDGAFTTLRVGQGLPAERLSSVIEDHSGFLWLAGNDRILRISGADFRRAAADRSRVHAKLFDTSDGLRGDPLFGVGYPNVARDPSGRLWFVTTVGIYLVNPTRVAEHQAAPLVKIEDVLVDDERFSPSGPLALPTSVSRLQVNYTALSLRAPTKIRFRHKLEGIDTDWIDNGASRHASYVNLGPGRYRFRVDGSIEDGVWNGAAIDLVIPAAFYETRWFFATCLAAFGLLGVGAWQIRMAQIRKRFSFVLLERARVARELHDTLLQSVVGLGLQLDNISDALTSSSPEALREELRRLRKQVEHDVIEARQSIWDLRQPEVETQDLVTALRETARSIVAGTKVTLDVVVKGTPRPCSPRMQQQLSRVVQEAVTNAVRHGRPGRISVEICCESRELTIRIADDGTGFVPSETGEAAGNHWGLVIMGERARQVGGHLEVVSAPERGTVIELNAPLPEHPRQDAP